MRHRISTLALIPVDDAAAVVTLSPKQYAAGINDDGQISSLDGRAEAHFVSILYGKDGTDVTNPAHW